MLRNVTRNVIRNLFGELSDLYAIAGFSPKLVFAPKADTYRTGGSASTFAGMIDYTGASNKTMVDSDGVLKWAPHNLLTWSEDAASATKTRVTVISGDTSGPFSGTTADRVTQAAGQTDGGAIGSLSGEIISGAENTYKAIVKNGNCDWVRIRMSATAGLNSVWFNISTGAVGTTNPGATGSIQDLGGGFYEVTATVSFPANFALLYLVDGDGSTTAVPGEFFYLHRRQNHRSDLGGMADNPDRGDSYVPTTSAARYLSRRNHHVYEGGEWVNAGMLVEPTAATNLNTNSSVFASGWGLTNATAVDNVTTSPDGTLNAAEYEHTTSTSQISKTYTVVSGTTYTASTFLKANTNSWVRFAGSGVIGAWFNVVTGAVGTREASNVSATIEAYGGGWYRCSITFVATSTSFTLTFANSISDNSTVEQTGVTGYVYQVDFIAGSVPMSPIPTAGSTATRAAETVSLAAVKVPYSATAMSIAMRGRMTYADLDVGESNLGGQGNAVWYLWKGDVSNYAEAILKTASSRTGQAFFHQKSAGVEDSSAGPNGSYSPGINVPFSIASRHGSTFINGAVDGTALTANLTPTSLPNLSATNLSLAFSGGPMIIEEFVMWDVDLGDSGIAEASA